MRFAGSGQQEVQIFGGQGAQDAGVGVHDGVGEASLGGLESEDLLLHRVLGHDAVGHDPPGLANAVGAVDGLGLDGRVPPGVEENHVVGCGEIEAQPWLEPDVVEAIRGLDPATTPAVVVAPIGFLSDHMEVVYDLDTEAKAAAEAMGLVFVRAGSPGTHPAFVSMIRELVQERMTANPHRAFLGTLGPSHDICPARCCLSGSPARPSPSLCGNS